MNTARPAEALASAKSPRAYEAQAVTVLALGFGLVGIDRFLISTMFPTIAKDLHLNYADIGTIAGALSIAWGLAALFMGNLSDHIGRRRVLTVSLIAFSVLIGASGLATGLASLVAVRLVMGFADGAYTPASLAATVEATPPERHGRNIGIQQMMLPLLGLGLSPLIVNALLRVISWRWIFSIFIVPGLVVAWLNWRVIRPPVPQPKSAHSTLKDWGTVLSYGNVRVLMLCMLCWIATLVTTTALLPSYLVDFLKLSNVQMGNVMSATGFGAAAGTLLLPWLSDRLGRRPVMLMATVVEVGALLWLASLPGGALTGLFVALFMVHFCNNALIVHTVGPVCAETVPPTVLATASGAVIAVGELFGGGLAPGIAGALAQRFGIGHILWWPIVAIAIGFVLCLMLKETRPAVVRSARLA
jgi:MFS family permease